MILKKMQLKVMHQGEKQLFWKPLNQLNSCYNFTTCNSERIRTRPWIIQLFSWNFQDCICLDVKLPSRWHFSARSLRLITSFLPFILISKLLRRHSAGNLWLSKFIAFGLANNPYFMNVLLCYTFLPGPQWDRWLMIRSFFLSILDEPVLKLGFLYVRSSKSFRLSHVKNINVMAFICPLISSR